MNAAYERRRSAHLDEVYPHAAVRAGRAARAYISRMRQVDACSISMAATPSRRSATATRARPRRIERQAAQLLFQSNAVPLAVRDARPRSSPRSRRAASTRVFFVNSGAEANENALRLALKLTGRSKIVALEHGFHGRTAAAAAVTWGAAEKWYGFPRTPMDVDVRAARRRRRARARPSTHDTAAVIVEPVQGLAGALRLRARILRAARAGLRPQRRAADPRRGANGHGPPRRAFRRRSLRRSARSAHDGQRARRRISVRRRAHARTRSPQSSSPARSARPSAAARSPARPSTPSSTRSTRRACSSNVARCRASFANAACVGPVEGIAGRGFLLGLRTTAARCRRPRCAARARHLDRHERRPARAAAVAAADARTTSTCNDSPTRLEELDRCNALTIWRTSRREEISGAARARGAPRHAARAARARRQGAVAAVPEPVAAHAGVVPGRDGAARRRLVRDLARDVHSRARDAPRHRHGRRCGRARARGRARDRLVRRRARHPRVRASGAASTTTWPTRNSTR